MNDELLNKYIDGELSGTEKLHFEKMLSESAELRARLDTMMRLDRTLRKMEPDNPSEMFTSHVMNRLKKKVSYSRSNDNFIKYVAGFIVLLCLGIAGYFIATAVASAGDSGSATFSQQLNNGIENVVHVTRNIFKPEFFSYIGALISMIILISGYYFFETQRKAFRKR